MSILRGLITAFACLGLPLSQAQEPSTCVTTQANIGITCSPDSNAFGLWSSANDAVQSVLQKVDDIANGFGLGAVAELASMATTLVNSVDSAHNELEGLKCLVPSQAADLFSGVSQTVNEFTNMLDSLEKSSGLLTAIPGASNAVQAVVQQGVSSLDSYIEQISSLLQSFPGNYPCSGITTTNSTILLLNSALKTLNTAVGMSVSPLTGIEVNNCRNPTTVITGLCPMTNIATASPSDSLDGTSMTTQPATAASESILRVGTKGASASTTGISASSTEVSSSDSGLPASTNAVTSTPSLSERLSSISSGHTDLVASTSSISASAKFTTDAPTSSSSAPDLSATIKAATNCLTTKSSQGISCSVDDNSFGLWSNANAVVQSVLQRVNKIADGFGLGAVTELASIATTLVNSVNSAHAELEGLKCLVPSQAADLFSGVSQTIDDFTGMLDSLEKSSGLLTTIPGASGAVQDVVQQGISALSSYIEQVSSLLQKFPGNYPCSGITYTNLTLSLLNSVLEKLNPALGMQVSAVTGIKVKNCRNPTTVITGLCSATSTDFVSTASSGSTVTSISDALSQLGGGSSSHDDGKAPTLTSSSSATQVSVIRGTSAVGSSVMKPASGTASSTLSGIVSVPRSASLSSPISSELSPSASTHFAGEGSEATLSPTVAPVSQYSTASSGFAFTTCLTTKTNQGILCSASDDTFGFWSSANEAITSVLDKVNALADGLGIGAVADLASMATNLVEALNSARIQLENLKCLAPSQAASLFSGFGQTISEFNETIETLNKSAGLLTSIPGAIDAAQTVMQQGVSALNSYTEQVSSLLQSFPGNYACSGITITNSTISLLNTALDTLNTALGTNVLHATHIKVSNCRNPTTVIAGMCRVTTATQAAVTEVASGSAGVATGHSLVGPSSLDGRPRGSLIGTFSSSSESTATPESHVSANIRSLVTPRAPSSFPNSEALSTVIVGSGPASKALESSVPNTSKIHTSNSFSGEPFSNGAFSDSKSTAVSSLSKAVYTEKTPAFSLSTKAASSRNIIDSSPVPVPAQSSPSMVASSGSATIAADKASTTADPERAQSSVATSLQTEKLLSKNTAGSSTVLNTAQAASSDGDHGIYTTKAIVSPTTDVVYTNATKYSTSKGTSSGRSVNPNQKASQNPSERAQSITKTHSAVPSTAADKHASSGAVISSSSEELSISNSQGLSSTTHTVQNAPSSAVSISSMEQTNKASSTKDAASNSLTGSSLQNGAVEGSTLLSNPSATSQSDGKLGRTTADSSYTSTGTGTFGNALSGQTSNDLSSRSSFVSTPSNEQRSSYFAVLTPTAKGSTPTEVTQEITGSTSRDYTSPSTVDHAAGSSVSTSKSASIPATSTNVASLTNVLPEASNIVSETLGALSSIDANGASSSTPSALSAGTSANENGSRRSTAAGNAPPSNTERNTNSTATSTETVAATTNSSKYSWSTSGNTIVDASPPVTSGETHHVSSVSTKTSGVPGQESSPELTPTGPRGSSVTHSNFVTDVPASESGTSPANESGSGSNRSTGAKTGNVASETSIASSMHGFVSDPSNSRQRSVVSGSTGTHYASPTTGNGAKDEYSSESTSENHEPRTHTESINASTTSNFAGNSQSHDANGPSASLTHSSNRSARTSTADVTSSTTGRTINSNTGPQASVRGSSGQQPSASTASSGSSGIGLTNKARKIGPAGCFTAVCIIALLI